MTFDPKNLRLEVEVTPPEIRNLCQNPNGQLGAWGWITPVSNTNITTSGEGYGDIDEPFVNAFVTSWTRTTDGLGDPVIDLVLFNDPFITDMSDYVSVGDSVILMGSDDPMTFTEERLTVVKSVGATTMRVFDVYDGEPTIEDFVRVFKPGYSMMFQTAVSQAARFETEPEAATAGLYYQARMDVLEITASHTYRLEFVFLASDKTTVLQTTTQSASKGVPGAFYGPFQAPANTAYVKLRVRLYNGTGTTNPAAGAHIVFHRVMIAESATNTSVRTRTNLITDPSVQVGISAFTGFSGTTLSWSTSTPKYGTRCLQAVSTKGGAGINAFSSGINLSMNSQYTISFYVRSSVARSFRIDRIMQTSTGYKKRIQGQTISLPANTYVRYEHTFTTGGFNKLARMEMLTSNSGTFRFDGFLLEKTNKALEYFDGSIVPAGYASSAWNGTANASTSTAQTAAGVFDYTSTREWMNILPSSAEIEVSGSELDIRTLTATLLDESFDPALSTVIKPGRAIRLQAYVYQENQYAIPVIDRWFPVYTGVIDKASAEYDYKKGVKVPVRTRIECVDNVAKLAAKSEPRMVADAYELPGLLEGNGVPWNILSDRAQNFSLTVAGTDENKTLIDQIALARDSYLNGSDGDVPGPLYAWVDRDGVLQARVESIMEPSDEWLQLHLSDNPDDLGYSGPDGTWTTSYSALPAGFSTQNCINVLNLTVQTWNTGEQALQETKYTFENPASIKEWGRCTKDITVFGGGDGFNANTFGNAIVNGDMSVPVRYLESATIPAKSDVDLYLLANLDLYRQVYITNSKADLAAEKHLVSTLNHRISVTNKGAKWEATITFAPTGAVASPAVQPAVGITNAGTPMLVMDKNASAQALVADAWTVVSGWDIVTNTGFTSVAGSAVTVATPGVYFISFTVGYNAVASRCITSITINSTNGGVGSLGREDNESTTATRIAHNVSAIVSLSAGDVIRGLAFSNAVRNVEQNLSAMNVYRIGS